MSRTARLEAILRIVHTTPIANQAELVEALEQRGISATQATVSRDVRHLGLVKVPGSEGKSQYVPPEVAVSRAKVGDRWAALRPVFQQSVSQVDAGGPILVVKTPVGFANAVAVALDSARLQEVVGTIAGDDTLLVILREEADRNSVLSTFCDLMA